MESKDKVVIDVYDRKTEDKSKLNASNPQEEPAPIHCHFDDNISNEAKELETYVKGKVSVQIRNKGGILGELGIYRVPKKHLNKNQDAYTPRIISIGPLHRDESHLQAMEEHKLRYLFHFLKISRLSMVQLAEYVHLWKAVVKYFYEDIYIRDQSKLSQIMLLDGVFVVELFLMNYFPKMRVEGDKIYENRWVSNDVLHDLLLLENQLPFVFLLSLYYAFVYKEVYKFLDDGTNSSNIPSFFELARKYFKDVCNTGKQELGPNLQHPKFNEEACSVCDVSRPSALWGFLLWERELPRHLVEFLAILHKPSTVRQEVKKPKSDFARCSTATELRAAGVKLRKGPEELKCIFDVRFENGELSIPQLVINDFTETFFRNSIALEQSGRCPKNITSYVILLDSLIDTQKDVDLLIKHGIIDLQLGSPEQVSEVFNNLYKEFVSHPEEFYFDELCSELNGYSRDWWHKWISAFSKWSAMLRKDYFGSPWSVISVMAASVLLVLTVIQTVCSLLQSSK